MIVLLVAMTSSYSRPWHLVLALTIAYTASFLDRYLLNLFVEPIKHAFALTDVRISLLQGVAFSLFLVVSGLPIGWFIDHSRRLTVLAIGIALWSVATIACGFATSYTALLLCRVGVAIGEATLLPAGASLLVDAMPRERLGLGFGVFSTGASLGGGLAFLLGATVIARLSASPALTLPLIGTIAPWQGTFIAVGMPGLALALWIMLLREPVRRCPHLGDQASHGAMLSFFRANAASLTTLMLSGAFAAMSAQAIAAWMPSLLIRIYGFSVPQAGTAFGSLVILGGMGGIVLGGLLGDFLSARGRDDGRIRAIIAGSVLAAPFCVAAPLAGNAAVTLYLLAPALLFGTIFIANSGAALQEILPSYLQGFTAAIAVLVSNVIGLGLGPTAVAILTDEIFHDETKLPAALATVSLSALALSILFGTLALASYRKSHAGAKCPGD
jgi:MFS family permease